MRGRVKQLPHKKSRQDPTAHEFHFDWSYPGEERGGETLKVMVGRMRENCDEQRALDEVYR